MTRGARVIYLGFGGAGCTGLEQLASAGADVVAVVPRASDDGTSTSSVRRHAQVAGLPLLETVTPGSREFRGRVHALAPDYLVSVQYDRILGKRLLAIPRLGSLNLHFSPLPRLRGCFPTKWAIIEDEPSGVTLHRIDPGVDTGAIIDQRLLPLQPDDTDASLYARLETLAPQVLGAHARAIARGTVPAGTPQREAQSSYHPSGLPHEGRIDWNRDARWVERFVRAMTFPPHPAATSRLGALGVQIPAPVRVLEGDSLGPGVLAAEPGGTGVIVGCADGQLLCPTVIIDGREQNAATLLAPAVTARRFEEVDAGSRQELTARAH